MKTSFRLAGLGLAFLAATGAFADTASATSTTTGTTTTAARPTHGGSVSMGQFCSGGGSRTVTGGLDSTTGALDVTTTYAACKTQRGDLIDGTAKSTSVPRVSSITEVARLERILTRISLAGQPAAATAVRHIVGKFPAAAGLRALHKRGSQGQHGDADPDRDPHRCTRGYRW